MSFRYSSKNHSYHRLCFKYTYNGILIHLNITFTKRLKISISSSMSCTPYTLSPRNIKVHAWKLFHPFSKTWRCIQTNGVLINICHTIFIIIAISYPLVMQYSQIEWTLIINFIWGTNITKMWYDSTWFDDEFQVILNKQSIINV